MQQLQAVEAKSQEAEDTNALKRSQGSRPNAATPALFAELVRTELGTHPTLFT